MENLGELNDRIQTLTSRLNHLQVDIDGTIQELIRVMDRVDKMISDSETESVLIDFTDTMFGSEDYDDEGVYEEPKSDRDLWTDFFGVDPEPAGTAIYVRARAIKNALNLTWAQTANVIAGAPDYGIPDAPEPLSKQTLMDLKYEPRWYPSTPDGRYHDRWNYPMRDVERMEYAFDAADYWIQTFGIDENEALREVLEVRDRIREKQNG